MRSYNVDMSCLDGNRRIFRHFMEQARAKVKEIKKTETEAVRQVQADDVSESEK